MKTFLACAILSIFTQKAQFPDLTQEEFNQLNYTKGSEREKYLNSLNKGKFKIKLLESCDSDFFELFEISKE